ncbi:hypothetical protein Esti_004755 [Eimeria stiedai]
MEDTRDRALLQHTARQDAIRFEMIVKELKCAREWQQNWGFLNDLYPPSDKLSAPTVNDGAVAAAPPPAAVARIFNCHAFYMPAAVLSSLKMANAYPTGWRGGLSNFEKKD